MKNKLLIYFGIIICLYITILGTTFVSADTGTYLIEKQYVNLTVHTDRTVDIEYYMKWKVTGGNIPWVTLGLPNSNYQIVTYSGDAQNVKHQDSGGWSGVYITLDKTYYQNDEFEFIVKVTQKDFVKNYNGKASIQFTPTWWDNAQIEELIVRLIPPNAVKSIEAGSEPTRYEGNAAVWEWNNVGRGSKKTVSALIDISVFPGLNETATSGTGTILGGNSDSSSDSSFLWIILIGIIAVVVIIPAISSIFDDYSSPSLHLSSSKSSTRHINMNCPNDNAALNKIDLKENTVDFCDVCGGAFFDKGEIETLIKDKIDERDFNKNNKKVFAEPKQTISKCPRCEGNMVKKERNKGGVSVKIFVCNDCGGIWLNKGIYQVIKDKRLVQEEEAKKKKDDDDDYFPLAWWLFYPHIGSTGAMSHSTVAHFGGGSFGGGGGSSVHSVSSCACVSCACVSACACACACAGGGAAGCSNKNKLECHQINIKMFYPKQKDL